MNRQILKEPRKMVSFMLNVRRRAHAFVLCSDTLYEVRM